MVTVGMDVHKSFSYVTATDDGGQILDQRRLANTRKELSSYFTGFDSPPQVAMEACWNWQWIAELLEKRGCAVYLSHPLKTRAIASARIKTDKVDSAILAQLLRTDLLPTAYIADRKVRFMRDVLRHRVSLTESRTRLANRARVLLAREGIEFPYRTLFTQKGRCYLREVRLPGHLRQRMDHLLGQEALLDQQIRETDALIEREGLRDGRVSRLTVIPGIGIYTAMVLLYEIGDIDRFPSAKHLCSYFGLVPSVHQSGDKRRTGHITKAGSRYARFVLVQAAHHAAKGPYKGIYYKIKKKRGSSIAHVAVARKMAMAVYAILKEGETFKR